MRTLARPIVWIPLVVIGVLVAVLVAWAVLNPSALGFH